MQAPAGTLYIIGDAGDDEWVSPEPADAVVLGAVAEATDLAREDLDALEAYVDSEALAAVVGTGDDPEVTFTVEDHAVTVTSDGDVSVE